MSHRCHYCDDQCQCDGTREWKHPDHVQKCSGCHGPTCMVDKPPTYDPTSDPDAEPLREEKV